MTFAPNDRVIVTIGTKPPEPATVVGYDTEAKCWMVSMDSNAGVQGLVEEAEMAAA